MAKDHSRAPLFDRLVDFEARRVRAGPGSRGGPPVGGVRLDRESEAPYRTLDRQDLLESVRRELQRLFDVRSPLPAHLAGQRELTVVDYGIPDTTALAPSNQEDRAALEELVRRPIEAFEPRLRGVRVRVSETRDDYESLTVEIEGEVQVGGIWEPVWFPAKIRRGGSEVRIGD